MTSTVTTRADVDCVAELVCAGLILGAAGAYLRMSTPLSYPCARVES